MAKADEYDEHGPLTPEDMRNWLRQELFEVSKAAELRTNEATDFVTAYTKGKISEKEMQDRLSVYHYRWGDSPIPGVTTYEGITDEEILKRLDAGLPKTVRETVRRHLAKSEDAGHKRE